MRWWFGAFRKDGGPTWYGDNRTAVVTDTTTVTIVIVFAIFLLAFLVIFPGIRRERWSSFFSVILTLSVGAILLGSNKTLENHHFNYNERFHFTEVKSMEKELANGLHKGLPYPILSVIEYLSVDRAGFIWGRQYRLAGYYTCILLWLSFALWILQVLMLCLVPQYFSRTLLVVGSSIALADIVYVLSSPRKFHISFPDAEGDMAVLSFNYGWCLWATIGAGVCCLLMGCVIRLLEAKSLYHFVTFLQADFDEVTRSPKARGEPRERIASHLSLGFTQSGNLDPKSSNPTPSPASLTDSCFVDRDYP